MSMSYEAARQAILNYVKAQWALTAFASTPVEYENLETIDHNTRVDPFVTVDIEYADAQQASIELAPLTRRYGELAFHIHVKSGKGSKSATDRADAIDNFMKFKKISGVQFRAARLLRAVPFDGWEIYPVRVSFYYDN